LLKAIQSVSKAEVVSTPRILTDDGERAEIRVQREVPVTSTNALNTSTTTTSFKEFVSAGTVLIIKPQIIHNKWLRLEIEQNIEDFVGSPPAPGVPPPKSSRSLKTVVTVPNGQMIILGGLCDRREVETIDKIPILGDIPILGLLFQSRTYSVSKTSLYIFIQPTILNDPEFEDLETISKQDLKKIKKLQEKAK
jgi:general secretion pathway protein D